MRLNYSSKEFVSLHKNTTLIIGCCRGGGGYYSNYNGLCGDALPERGPFFRLGVYKRVGITVNMS